MHYIKQMHHFSGFVASQDTLSINAIRNKIYKTQVICKIETNGKLSFSGGIDIGNLLLDAVFHLVVQFMRQK